MNPSRAQSTIKKPKLSHDHLSLSQLVITPHLINHLNRAQVHIIHLGMLIRIHIGTHIVMDPTLWFTIIFTIFLLFFTLANASWSWS